jgi:hypothetical protein
VQRLPQAAIPSRSGTQAYDPQCLQQASVAVLDTWAAQWATMVRIENKDTYVQSRAQWQKWIPHCAEKAPGWTISAALQQRMQQLDAQFATLQTPQSSPQPQQVAVQPLQSSSATTQQRYEELQKTYGQPQAQSVAVQPQVTGQQPQTTTAAVCEKRMQEFQGWAITMKSFITWEHETNYLTGRGQLTNWAKKCTQEVAGWRMSDELKATMQLLEEKFAALHDGPPTVQQCDKRMEEFSVWLERFNPAGPTAKIDWGTQREIMQKVSEWCYAIPGWRFPYGTHQAITKVEQQMSAR